MKAWRFPHRGLVLGLSGLLLLLFALSWTLGSEDGSLGGGFAILNLVLLGFPWSMTVFVSGLWQGRAATIAYGLFSLLNLLILVVFLARRPRHAG